MQVANSELFGFEDTADTGYIQNFEASTILKYGADGKWGGSCELRGSDVLVSETTSLCASYLKRFAPDSTR